MHGINCQLMQAKVDWRVSWWSGGKNCYRLLLKILDTQIVLDKFAFDIACLLLYCVSVTALRVEFIYFFFYDNVGIYKIYWICLYLHRFCSTVFTHIS